MDYMSFFLSVLISQISIHFYLGDFQDFKLGKYSFSAKRNLEIGKTSVSQISNPVETNFNSTSPSKVEVAEISDDRFILKRNLKHLEFINFLESHIYNKSSEKIPLDFLNEFNTIKQDIQLKTIEATKKLA